MRSDWIKIGELAREAEVSADTLRYYEKEGLLMPVKRSASGYRLYARDELKRIGFILAAKEVGFSLGDIKQLLSLEVTKDEQTCASVKSFVDKKVVDVEAKLKKLRRIKKSLMSLSDACCGGAEPATHCSILETLGDHSLANK